MSSRTPMGCQVVSNESCCYFRVRSGKGVGVAQLVPLSGHDQVTDLDRAAARVVGGDDDAEQGRVRRNAQQARFFPGGGAGGDLLDGVVEGGLAALPAGDRE